MAVVDRTRLARQGYTVVTGVAPEALLAPARDAITGWLGVDLARPDTWYPTEPLDGSVVPIHHPQAFWDLRQLPELHRVFAEVLGTPELWVTMDRGIYKVPASAAHPDHMDTSRIHWDVDPRTVRLPAFQGMLFLTDAPPDQGPFACVPSLYADLDRYLATLPDLDIEAPLDLAGHDVVAVPAHAGDLVIWDVRLPHHGGPNVGRAPRVSVAITMHRLGSEDERAERIRCWEQRRAPVWWRGWKGQIDPEPGVPAELTPLGRKLVGVDSWDP